MNTRSSRVLLDFMAINSGDCRFNKRCFYQDCRVISALSSVYDCSGVMIAGWLGGVVARALDSRSIGRGFNSRPVHRRVATLGKLFTVHTHVPLSPSSIIWYRPRGGDALRLGR